MNDLNDIIIKKGEFYVQTIQKRPGERTGQEISLGMGFRDRPVAFDLIASINEQIRQTQRQQQVEEKLAHQELLHFLVLMYQR